MSGPSPPRLRTRRHILPNACTLSSGPGYSPSPSLFEGVPFYRKASPPAPTGTPGCPSHKHYLPHGTCALRSRHWPQFNPGIH